MILDFYDFYPNHVELSHPHLICQLYFFSWTLAFVESFQSIQLHFPLLFIETTKNSSFSLCSLSGVGYYLTNQKATGTNWSENRINSRKAQFFWRDDEVSKCVTEEPAGIFCGKPSRSQWNGRHRDEEEIKCFFGGLPWQAPTYKMMASVPTTLIFFFFRPGTGLHLEYVLLTQYLTVGSVRTFCTKKHSIKSRCDPWAANCSFHVYPSRIICLG